VNACASRMRDCEVYVRGVCGTQAVRAREAAKLNAEAAAKEAAKEEHRCAALRGPGEQFKWIV
jgi:hypothetical protein